MQNISNSQPVGIFDSGVGGLTVMKEIVKLIPDEDIIYFGDTARVPYGTRSPETVIKYSLKSAQFLVSKGVKVLVIACNTSSSVSLDKMKEMFSVPVVGVVEPGARAAAAAKSRFKKVAVIGTRTTIESNSYVDAIKAIDETITVTGIPCPLFVPLIEEGWTEGEIVTLTAEKYLSPIRYNGLDSIVLGCTHYPIIKDIISRVVDVPLIDSAVETAHEVRKVMENLDINSIDKKKGSVKFYVTDSPDKFVDMGKRFLGYDILNISKIDLDE